VEDLNVFLAVLFVSVAGLNVIARWLDVPYPIVLVIGGIVLGAIPGIPDIVLDPDLVLVIFLPPLLYSAAFFADLQALRADARAITLAATGMVLASTVGVAIIAHELIDLPWAVSFALGAIVSPTDPLAATEIMRRVGAPRRTVNVIEGESLTNDATALVAYKVAVAAAVGEGVTLGEASLDFVTAAAGGIAIGLAVGYVVAAIRRRIDDPPTEITISLFTGYGAFIAADSIGSSGVLAVVTTGLYLGWRAPQLITPDTRLQVYAFWEVLIFLVNAILFILIGLQLPTILDNLQSLPAGDVAGYTIAIVAAVIGIRFLWLFTMPYVIRALDRRPAQRARRVGIRDRIVYGWAGMRGAVSLAAALALPLTTDAGAPLPGRDLILFITFSLIVVTVVGQGLTLPWLIRRLGVHEEEGLEESEETRARLAASKAALIRLEEVEGEEWVREETAERVRALYRYRKRRFAIRAGMLEDEDGIEDRSLAYQRLMHVLFDAQREALIGLRNEGAVSIETLRRIERELDLEESRLEV
jgi:CPA1 family monovalent cation:H+ antiporter